MMFCNYSGKFYVTAVLYQIQKDLARPQHRTIMLFITNYQIGKRPKF